MKRTILFLVCLMGMTFAFAQGNMQDVVYLKNGSIIRGDIIEMVPSETVKIMTADGCVFIYDFADVEKFTKEQPKGAGPTANFEKKSPWLSGFFSWFIPGLGQFYNGEHRKGWIDLGTGIGGYVAMFTGGILMTTSESYDYSTGIYTVNDAQYIPGLILALGGMGVLLANHVHTIADAFKSSKRINAENGYVMYQINDRCAFGMQPSIAYERPQYLQGSKPEL